VRSTGIRRKVDDLGRVVIPASIRRSLHIREGDEVEVHVDGEHVILAKPTIRCVLCGTEDGDLQQVRDRRLCRACIASVGVLDESLRERAREAAAGTATPSGWQPPAAVVEEQDRAPAVVERERAPAMGEAADVVASWPPEPAPGVAARPDGVVGRGDGDEDPVGEDLYDPASTTAW
jgi:AbrB family transcriptional regulator, transcriptional pleiotropic regulator of transition state genes